MDDSPRDRLSPVQWVPRSRCAQRHAETRLVIAARQGTTRRDTNLSAALRGRRAPAGASPWGPAYARPVTWQPELDELRRRRELAAAMGGPERVERQRASGRLTVRERVEALADAGSFREVGGLAGVGAYGADGDLEGFTPANCVIGEARLDGRRAVLQADDFTVRGGAADAAIWQKMVHAERMAHDGRMPLVRLVDGTGGGGSVKSLEQMGFSYVPVVPGWELAVENLARVPVVAAALGPVAGLGFARVVSTHFSVAVTGLAQLFVAGPPVVAAAMPETPDKETLGGTRNQARSGAIDNEAAGEAEAFAQLRRFLSYLPASVWEAPPLEPTGDPPDRRAEELLSLVPREPRRPYDARRLLALVLDTGSVFELGARFGRPLVCALARLGGAPVGVLASDPKHWGGGLTGDAADKLVRFVDLCDQFRLPVVNFVDQPGFVIGTEAERAGTMRRGARALAAVYQSTVPWAAVLVRKVYGIAGASHAPHHRLHLRVAWPSGDWGSLPIAGGLEAAYRRELEAAADPVALRGQIQARLDAVRSPFRTAERFGVEDVIDPRETRPLLCDWAARAHELVVQEIPAGPIKARGPRP
jgi:acetyl-CoA carboxylase carboxyltransferase component